MSATQETVSNLKPLINDGRYVINESTSTQDLLEDASCWLESVESTISTLAMELACEDSDLAANPRHVSNMLFGARSLLEMAKSAVNGATSQVLEEKL